MTKTNIIATIILTLILITGGYLYYTQTSESVTRITGAITTEVGTTTDADQDQTLQRLNTLEDIEIDSEFLNSSTFGSLENYGISIEPQPVGRSNPFEEAETIIIPNVSENSVSIESTTGSSSQRVSTSSDPVQQLLESEATSTSGVATTSSQ
jgi:hypothetical protein